MSASVHSLENLRTMQSELRALAQKFAKTEMKQYVEEDERNHFFRRSHIEKMGALGLTGVTTAEKFGGSELGYFEYIAVIEELAKVHAAYAVSVAVTGLPQVILSKYGTPAQQERWVSKLASGQAVGGFALSEASSGSDAASLRTSAVKTDRGYLVNGTKLWCTQGDSSDVILLMARTGGPGPKGVSAFLLEKGTPGFSIGKIERKMGLNSSHTCELILENVLLPFESLVGKEGDGFKFAMEALDSGRITIAAVSLGLAEAALEVATQHAVTREQFQTKIADFQGIQFMIADMKTSIEASRLLIENAALRKDQGLPFSEHAAMAKLFATDTAMNVTTNAVQILGGGGYTEDFPAERFMREAKMMQIVEGTNQVQRVVIARNHLKNYRNH